MRKDELSETQKNWREFWENNIPNEYLIDRDVEYFDEDKPIYAPGQQKIRRIKQQQRYQQFKQPGPPGQYPPPGQFQQPGGYPNSGPYRNPGQYPPPEQFQRQGQYPPPGQFQRQGQYPPPGQFQQPGAYPNSAQYYNPGYYQKPIKVKKKKYKKGHSVLWYFLIIMAAASLVGFVTGLADNIEKSTSQFEQKVEQIEH